MKCLSFCLFFFAVCCTYLSAYPSMPSSLVRDEVESVAQSRTSAVSLSKREAPKKKIYVVKLLLWIDSTPKEKEKEETKLAIEFIKSINRIMRKSGLKGNMVQFKIGALKFDPEPALKQGNALWDTFENWKSTYQGLYNQSNHVGVQLTRAYGTNKIGFANIAAVCGPNGAATVSGYQPQLKNGLYKTTFIHELLHALGVNHDPDVGPCANFIMASVNSGSKKISTCSSKELDFMIREHSCLKLVDDDGTDATDNDGSENEDDNGLPEDLNKYGTGDGGHSQIFFEGNRAHYDYSNKDWREIPNHPPNTGVSNPGQENNHESDMNHNEEPMPENRVPTETRRDRGNNNIITPPSLEVLPPLRPHERPYERQQEKQEESHDEEKQEENSKEKKEENQTDDDEEKQEENSKEKKEENQTDDGEEKQEEDPKEKKEENHTDDDEEKKEENPKEKKEENQAEGDEEKETEDDEEKEQGEKPDDPKVEDSSDKNAELTEKDKKVDVKVSMNETIADEIINDSNKETSSENSMTLTKLEEPRTMEKIESDGSKTEVSSTTTIHTVSLDTTNFPTSTELAPSKTDVALTHSNHVQPTLFPATIVPDLVGEEYGEAKDRFSHSVDQETSMLTPLNSLTAPSDSVLPPTTVLLNSVMEPPSKTQAIPFTEETTSPAEKKSDIHSTAFDPIDPYGFTMDPEKGSGTPPSSPIQSKDFSDPASNENLIPSMFSSKSNEITSGTSLNENSISSIFSPKSNEITSGSTLNENSISSIFSPTSNEITSGSVLKENSISSFFSPNSNQVSFDSPSTLNSFGSLNSEPMPASNSFTSSFPSTGSGTGPQFMDTPIQTSFNSIQAPSDSFSSMSPQITTSQPQTFDSPVTMESNGISNVAPLV